MPYRVNQLQLGSGAIRNQPISDRLLTLLDNVGEELDVYFDVGSGGQPSKGSRRTGSHRHDHGESADVKAYVFDANGDKQYLDFTTPNGREAWERIVQLSASYGATGIGAGVSYMGPRTVHIGYGAPATWGAGGHKANAPAWLRAAYKAGQTTPPMNIPKVGTKLDLNGLLAYDGSPIGTPLVAPVPADKPQGIQKEQVAPIPAVRGQGQTAKGGGFNLMDVIATPMNFADEVLDKALDMLTPVGSTAYQEAMAMREKNPPQPASRRGEEAPIPASNEDGIRARLTAVGELPRPASTGNRDKARQREVVIPASVQDRDSARAAPVPASRSRMVDNRVTPADQIDRSGLSVIDKDGVIAPFSLGDFGNSLVAASMADPVKQSSALQAINFATQSDAAKTAQLAMSPSVSKYFDQTPTTGMANDIGPGVKLDELLEFAKPEQPEQVAPASRAGAIKARERAAQEAVGIEPVDILPDPEDLMKPLDSEDDVKKANKMAKAGEKREKQQESFRAVLADGLMEVSGINDMVEIGTMLSGLFGITGPSSKIDHDSRPPVGTVLGVAANGGTMIQGANGVMNSISQQHLRAQHGSGEYSLAQDTGMNTGYHGNLG